MYSVKELKDIKKSFDEGEDDFLTYLEDEEIDLDTLATSIDQSKTEVFSADDINSIAIYLETKTKLKKESPAFFKLAADKDSLYGAVNYCYCILEGGCQFTSDKVRDTELKKYALLVNLDEAPKIDVLSQQRLGLSYILLKDYTAAVHWFLLVIKNSKDKDAELKKEATTKAKEALNHKIEAFLLKPLPEQKANHSVNGEVTRKDAGFFSFSQDLEIFDSKLIEMYQQILEAKKAMLLEKQRLGLIQLGDPKYGGPLCLDKGVHHRTYCQIY